MPNQRGVTEGDLNLARTDGQVGSQGAFVIQKNRPVRDAGQAFKSEYL